MRGKIFNFLLSLVFMLCLIGVQRSDAQKPIEDPTIGEGYHLTNGKYYFNQGKYDQAIKKFNWVIQMNPNSVDAYYNRGRAYVAKGDLDGAIADFTKVIEFNLPETIQVAYNNRGLAYKEKGDLDKALSDYTKGIEAMPNSSFSGFRMFKATLLINRASIYLMRSEYGKSWDDVHSIEKLGQEVDPEFIGKLKKESKREK